MDRDTGHRAYMKAACSLPFTRKALTHFLDTDSGSQSPKEAVLAAGVTSEKELQEGHTLFSRLLAASIFIYSSNNNKKTNTVIPNVKTQKAKFLEKFEPLSKHGPN
ncbi:hypothetical protein A6R68_00052 [Neotoma lepida]|uniref:Uncharacterized protein n=1 Tax=Neotoma lepida TaxID=56216 RepID=A0A1A6GZ44_NEOLE|nr:hypothetical protein A6R68_00052 [Neotoma lepida]